MSNFRFIADMDILPVMGTLHKLEPHKWRGEPAPEDGNDFGIPVKTRILRCHAGATVENWCDDLPVIDFPDLEKWPSMQRLLERCRQKVLADPIAVAVDPEAPVARAILALMPKETQLQWHIDFGPYHERHLRFHVPLTTNVGCVEIVGMEQVHFGAGSLWWFNHRVKHSCANWGPTSRIHLILELDAARSNNAGPD